MVEGMEWRPTPRPKEDARRKGDTEMGERMVRVEEGVNDLQSAVDRQGEAITRLHERVDEMNATLTAPSSSKPTPWKNCCVVYLWNCVTYVSIIGSLT